MDFDFELEIIKHTIFDVMQTASAAPIFQAHTESTGRPSFDTPGKNGWISDRITKHLVFGTSSSLNLFGCTIVPYA